MGDASFMGVPLGGAVLFSAELWGEVWSAGGIILSTFGEGLDDKQGCLIGRWVEYICVICRLEVGANFFLV